MSFGVSSSLLPSAGVVGRSRPLSGSGSRTRSRRPGRSRPGRRFPRAGSSHPPAWSAAHSRSAGAGGPDELASSSGIPDQAPSAADRRRGRGPVTARAVARRLVKPPAVRRGRPPRPHSARRVARAALRPLWGRCTAAAWCPEGPEGPQGRVTSGRASPSCRIGGSGPPPLPPRRWDRGRSHHLTHPITSAVRRFRPPSRSGRCSKQALSPRFCRSRVFHSAPARIRSFRKFLIAVLSTLSGRAANCR